MPAACLLQVYLNAAHAIHFEPSLREHAETVIRALRMHHGQYDGLHLRVEPDAQIFYWRDACSSIYNCTQKYLQTVAACSQNQAIYIASGIFMRGAEGRYLLDEREVLNVTSMFASLNKTVYHSSSFLSAAVAAQLNAEQLAAIEFLVLAQADRFVGVTFSTFSQWVSQWRIIHHHRKHIDNKFVDIDLGDDFYRATNDGHWFAAKIPSAF